MLKVNGHNFLSDYSTIVEKETLIVNFGNWLRSNNVKRSGKAPSYLKAIKMVFQFLDVKNIIDEHEIQRIKKFQEKVQNTGSKEYKDFYNHFNSKSYLEGGFVKAGLKSFFEFYSGRDSNNRSNEKQIVNANIGEVLFVNATEKQRCDGDEPGTEIEDDGKFVEDNKYGHELFNFRPDYFSGTTTTIPQENSDALVSSENTQRSPCAAGLFVRGKTCYNRGRIFWWSLFVIVVCYALYLASGVIQPHHSPELGVSQQVSPSLNKTLSAAAEARAAMDSSISNQQPPKGEPPIPDITHELERMKAVSPTFDSDYRTLHGG